MEAAERSFSSSISIFSSISSLYGWKGMWRLILSATFTAQTSFNNDDNIEPLRKHVPIYRRLPLSKTSSWFCRVGKKKMIMYNAPSQSLAYNL